MAAGHHSVSIHLVPSHVGRQHKQEREPATTQFKEGRGKLAMVQALKPKNVLELLAQVKFFIMFLVDVQFMTYRPYTNTSSFTFDKIFRRKLTSSIIFTLSKVTNTRFFPMHKISGAGF